MEKVVCNSFFKKDENKLVTYESGGTRSTIDHLLMRKQDEKCEGNSWRGMFVSASVSCWRLGSQRRPFKRRYVQKLRVWKLKEENVRKEFAEVLASRVSDVSEAQGANTKWEVMKNALLKTMEEVCGMTKGPP